MRPILKLLLRSQPGLRRQDNEENTGLPWSHRETFKCNNLISKMSNRSKCYQSGWQLRVCMLTFQDNRKTTAQSPSNWARTLCDAACLSQKVKGLEGRVPTNPWCFPLMQNNPEKNWRGPEKILIWGLKQWGNIINHLFYWRPVTICWHTSGFQLRLFVIFKYLKHHSQLLSGAVLSYLWRKKICIHLQRKSEGLNHLFWVSSLNSIFPFLTWMAIYMPWAVHQLHYTRLF